MIYRTITGLNVGKASGSVDNGKGDTDDDEDSDSGDEDDEGNNNI